VIARDWLLLECRPWRPREELEAEVDRLRAELEAARRLNDALCARGNRLEARVAELARGRRTKVDHAELLAELPLAPSLKQKKEAAAKHGVSLHQINKILRARGEPVRVRTRDLPERAVRAAFREVERRWRGATGKDREDL
jgi:hypothetical protein